MRLLRILYYHLETGVLRPVWRFLMRKPRLGSSPYDCKISVRKAKKILRKLGLGFDEKGNPSWWYTAFDGRNTIDQLTHAELEFIDKNVPKGAEILVTGCGAGLTTIWLAQRGYTKLDAFDYLQNVVDSAKEIASLA